MSNPIHTNTHTVKDATQKHPAIDPNYAQRDAADPDASVWVAASAGSGKTKVLTDRVLRLLLPRTDGRAGTPAEKILCLTFTKAGASEMALRINSTLAQWATMSLETTCDQAGKEQSGLIDVLKNLLGRTPSRTDIEEARKLFAQVVDVPGGLKITTIHAFCQSILGRFPLEAELPPHFSVLTDDASRALMQQARDQVLKAAVATPESSLHQAVSALAAALNDDQFATLMATIYKEREVLSKLFPAERGADQLFQTMCQSLGLQPEETEYDLIRKACADESFAVSDLRAACRVLCDQTGKTDQKNGLAMAAWLSAPLEERVKDFRDYISIYVKDDGDIRADKNLASVKAEAALPGIKELMQQEGARLRTVQDKLRALQSATMTHDLLIVAQEIIRAFQDAKMAQARLDFDDMINYTRRLLLRSKMSAWVLYKLDGGIDHILVDEAQDTNPEQWDIIESMVREFFAGAGARDIRRTLFVVGDEKQSIFSFQRAAPDRFREKRAAFKEIVEAAGETWREVPMEISFRSTSAVLEFTDEVFRAEHVRYGVSENLLQHLSFREGHAGHIEQWPLFRVPGDETAKNRDYWEPVLTPVSQRNARALLAQHISHTIEGWLHNKEMLPSRGRPIQPGDIMILVRNRNALVGHMIRELKARNIPVSGLDRMKLGDHIAVQDMLAVAKFALLPEDDLSLACVLKSPLINWNDQQLEDVALNRTGTLWKAVQTKAPDVADWLARAIDSAKAVRPYEFFSRLLQAPCPASSVSGLRAMTGRLGADALDPLDEFLSQVLGFEGDHISSVQGFVLWQAQNEAVIKREQEEAGGLVRIMTVHASKGLQAPIVILPDTVKPKGSGGGNRASDRLLWPAKTGLPFPFWSPHQGSDCAQYEAARETACDKDQQEYRRLLYVGLTRAEDRLYIGGAASERAHDEGSWYELTEAAFTRIDDAQKIPFNTSGDIQVALLNGEAQQSWVLSTLQKAQAQDKKAHAQQNLQMPDLSDPAWQWVRSAPAAEPAPPRPLIPSQASAVQEDDDLPALSPLKAQDNYRFRRGNLTHSLLQFLPDRAPGERAHLATLFAQRYGHDLPPSVQQSVVAETLRILEDPRYAPLFGPASRAEVPITGLINGKILSGQIDRLLVTDDAVHIIDYKTNRPPPTDPAQVPDIYRAQLQAYRETLTRIYPGHQIRTYLLWTDGPHLMEIIQAASAKAT